jgi:hypothetical protein
MARLGAAHAIVDDIRTSLVDLCSEFIVPAEAEDWQEGEGEVGDDEEEGEEDEGADAA